MDVGTKGQIVMPVLRWSLACFVTIYVLIFVGLAVFQRRLQYFSDRHLVDPAQAGMSGVEDLRLTTNDGELLVAWYVPATDGHPLILYFHGNGGALVDRVPHFSRLRRVDMGSCYILSRLWRLDWLADTKGPDGGWRKPPIARASPRHDVPDDAAQPDQVAHVFMIGVRNPDRR
jgi:hypothetical protein